MQALLFDTETTGLIENRLRALGTQSEVIEFYGCLADLTSGNVLEELELLIKPTNWPMSQQTLENTNSRITNDMLANALPFKEHADKIKRFIEGAPCVIAHNAAFDTEIIELEFERLSQTIEWPRVICTVEQTMHLKGHRLSLTNLYMHLFDSHFDEAHRAKADGLAMLRCCTELKRIGAL